MELRGEFRSVSEILDLIQIVSMGKKSGEMNFRGEEGSVTVYFDQGKAISFDSSIPAVLNIREAVKSQSLTLEEAIKLILHYISFWKGGRFLFVEKPISREHLGSVDMVGVMMEFSKEVDETPEEVRKAIADNLKFQLSEDIQGEICIDRVGWRLLREIAKGKSMKSLLFSLPFPYGVIVEKLQMLLNKGAICESTEVVEREELEKKEVKEEIPKVPEERIEKIKEILVSAMGPMGEFLVDEALEDLEVRELSPDMVNMFIDTLLEKIPETCLIEGESCRERFRKEFEKILTGG
ncbi:protein of unknown function [Desulfurobacterium pacificum]|jgi:hypothetical protein|uniref:DUF4388 domain-containing protein n=1 Tax=Desulfurobacterium pacificum TaxID=240166 RepID=A0ABY1NTK1_9BACT|nr:DUF4388 domain-containing protein [Desulfurobacterium pacificum]SMP16558.1 protein of unknown function [Desulfurobacterium pacificum]